MKRLLRKKPPVVVIDLDEYIIRITDERVDIETRAKTWKITYMKGSSDHAFWCWLLVLELFPHDPNYTERIKDEAKAEDRENAKAICRALFFISTFILKDAEVIREAFEVCERSVKRMEAAAQAEAVTKKEDAQILAEERALHEQDEESILKAQKKKNGKKTK
jgi:hypothetical protein